MRKPLAYLMSLLVWGAAVSTPTAVFGQTLPGSPFQGGGGGGVSLGGTNTWTGAQTFSARMQLNEQTGLNLCATDTGACGYIMTRTAQTPDAPMLATGTTSNSWIIAEIGDASFDFAHAQQTHPALFVHNADQASNEYTGLTATGLQGELATILTESAATSIVRIPIPTSGSAVGGTILYTVYATDSTDFQARSAEIRFAAVNKAGTETCVLNPGTVDQTTDGNAGAITAGTLTYAVTCSSVAAESVDIRVNAVSSLTQSALVAYYRLNMTGPVNAGVLPQ